MLSKATVTKLLTILREEYGYKCSYEEATNIANNLVRYGEILQEIKNNKL